MGVLATDNFNRANANPIGGNWTTIFGVNAMQIAGNIMTPSALGGNDCGAYYNAITWPANQYSQAQITVTGGTTALAGMGVAVRVQPAASAVVTYYVLVMDHQVGNNVFLWKNVAGTLTSLWQRTVTFNNGDLLRLEARGTILRGLINGVAIGADTVDTSIATGNVGIYYSSIETAASADNWEGGALVDSTLPLLGVG